MFCWTMKCCQGQRHSGIAKRLRNGKHQLGSCFQHALALETSFSSLHFLYVGKFKAQFSGDCICHILKSSYSHGNETRKHLVNSKQRPISALYGFSYYYASFILEQQGSSCAQSQQEILSMNHPADTLQNQP